MSRWEILIRHLTAATYEPQSGSINIWAGKDRERFTMGYRWSIKRTRDGKLRVLRWKRTYRSRVHNWHDVKDPLAGMIITVAKLLGHL